MSAGTQMGVLLPLEPDPWLRVLQAASRVFPHSRVSTRDVPWDHRVDIVLRVEDSYVSMSTDRSTMLDLTEQERQRMVYMGLVRPMAERLYWEACK